MNFESGGRRVGAGGRYDDLIGLVGGSPVPASGFALFVQPLADLLARGDTSEHAPPLVVGPDDDTAVDTAAALDTARRLRIAGFAVGTIGETHDGARLLCRGAAGDFTLHRDGHGLVLHSLDDVIAELEHGS